MGILMLMLLKVHCVYFDFTGVLHKQLCQNAREDSLRFPVFIKYPFIFFSLYLLLYLKKKLNFG